MCSHDERSAFFDALLARCTNYAQTCLTLTAIHPDGQRPVPSRHIQINNRSALHDAFTRLDAANALGWGAYFAVGLRHPGLSRWKRGGTENVVALPALFADVDDLSADALARLQCAHPVPSCIVASGGGYHAYWWLDEPTSDMGVARLLLHGLAGALGGDRLSVAQSLRVVGSVNTKPARANALCRLLELHDRRCCIHDFAAFLPRQVPSVISQLSQSTMPCVPSADLIARVTQALVQRGGRQHGEWVNSTCPFPERHKHGDRQPSFGFNTRSGYGFCHVCGTLLLSDLCPALGVSEVRQSRKEVTAGHLLSVVHDARI